ncbi:MAG: dihydrodipicolinate synthase family protein [Chloroflexota bacterium]
MQLSELRKAMKGVFIVLVTPFSDDGSVDLQGMRANVRWLLEHAKGKDVAIVPSGSTGEFYTLSDEEDKAVIKMVVEEVNGKLPVIAGTARAGTEETIKICQYAESVGADGVQVVLPYYHIAEEEGIFQHFKRIAEAIKIGVIIYNNPGPTGSWIKPPLMTKLSKIPNIVGVKENTPDVRAFNKIQRSVDSKNTAILCGLGEHLFSFEAVYDCPGFVSSAANFAPDLSYSIYQAAMARDFNHLRDLVTKMFPYFDFISTVNENHGPHVGIPGAAAGQAGYMYIGLVKAAMDLLGLRGGKVRLPLLDINDKERDELKAILRKMDLV